jgi:hypothetical protein
MAGAGQQKHVGSIVGQDRLNCVLRAAAGELAVVVGYQHRGDAAAWRASVNNGRDLAHLEIESLCCPTGARACG